MKSTLTKAQRHKIYKLAKENLLEGIESKLWLNYSICTELYNAHRQYLCYILRFSIPKIFPEFWQQRPSGISGEGEYWFNRRWYKRRLQILDKCIKLTKE